MRVSVPLGLALVAALAACAEPAPAPGPGNGGPAVVDPQPAAEQALTVSVDDLQKGDDGMIRGAIALHVPAGKTVAVRTVGLTLLADGATVVEWSRDDAFLKSGGGQVLQAVGKAEGARLELALATTAPATVTEDGAVLATFTLKPTNDHVGVSLALDGVLAPDGSTIAAATTGGAL